MIKLLKNANVYAPEKLGKKDILIEGEKILLMQDTIEGYEGLPGVETYDLEGKTVVPAYIDMHVHITGGGGEQGPASRVPESQLSEFFKNGITTVVGLLGTDGVTRSVENLVAKARALTEEGMTVYTLTSSYGYPPTTLTGSVERDIILVPPMIGVKVAVSDHRSSNPGGEELIALATAARRAGLLSNTPGLVTMHMGDGEGRLDPVFYVLDHSDVPAKNLLPTHILRNPGLIDAGAEVESGYAGDMSSTVPADKTFTPRQRAVYEIQNAMHLEAVKALCPGIPYMDVYDLSARVMVEGMKELGLMKGNAEDAVREGAHALFYPHGLGHMMGLDVHDMENLGELWVGYNGQPKSTQFGRKSQRLAIPLEPGFVHTVEPGIYFIPELIDLWKGEKKFKDFINYDKVEEYRNFGGIRNEEDYLITETGARRLGKKIPLTPEEVEALR